MKCPICDGNAMLFIKNNALVYKCLEEKCGKESEREVINKNVSNVKLRELRKRIESLNNSSDKPILISNIKKIRIDVGINQGEISKCLGVTAQRYGTMERCENIPTASKLMELSLIYDVTLDHLYDIVIVSEEQYQMLNRMVSKFEEDSVNAVKIEEDKNIELLEQEISDYEQKTGITERKIFDNQRQKDPKEVVDIKKELQKMDMDYVNYRKKQGAILKQKSVIDYYHWEVAKEMIGYKDTKNK